MVKAGMSPMDALKASTSVAARVLGIQDEVGRWAPGYMADILLVKGNPLEDIALPLPPPVCGRGGTSLYYSSQSLSSNSHS